MSTINDIAKMAGVSAATVSHVVNKTRFVSPELVKRVEDAIEALEFPPNFIVKKVKSAANNIDKKYVVLLSSNILNSYQKEMMRSIEKRLTEKKLNCISIDYDLNADRLELYFTGILNKDDILGIIAFPDTNDDKLRRLFSKINAPIVLVGKELKNFNCDVILSDNFGGAFRATSHLIKSGHEHIAIVCGNDNIDWNVERINGYKEALKANHIAINQDYIITNLSEERDFFNSMKKLFNEGTAPTAIFAANYNNLINLFKYIQANNISYPNDLSIVGFNDFDWAKLMNPPITAVAQDIESIAEKAVNILDERIEHISEISFGSAPQKITIPTYLKVRGSTSGIGRGPFGEKAASIDCLSLSEIDKDAIRSGNYTAAISFHYMGKSWMKLHEQGIKDVFDTFNISLLAITDAHFDPVMQNKQLNSILTLEPDVIISIPTDNSKTASAYKKIAKSNAKLVLITNVPDGLSTDDYVTCVSVNERSQGRNAGMLLGNYMTKKNLKKIGFLMHGATFYATNQRDNAAKQILVEEFPDLDIVDTAFFENEDDAYKKTIELINKNPEIEGLYISWEGPAIKSMSALSEIHRADIAVVTCDLEESVAVNMAKGGMIKAMSAQLPYEQGQAMALAAVNALLGKKVPSFIGIEPLSVRPDNLLKSWKTVYKSEPNNELTMAIKENPDFVSDI